MGSMDGIGVGKAAITVAVFMMWIKRVVNECSSSSLTIMMTPLFTHHQASYIYIYIYISEKSTKEKKEKR